MWRTDPLDPSSAARAEALRAERLRRLEPSAWAALYDEHHLRVWRYVYARTGQRDVADDLTADVFAEAVASIHRYRYVGKPVIAWLYRIARHRIGKWLRSQRRNPAALAPPTPEDLLDWRLLFVTLGQALQELTQDQRDVVLLRFFGDYGTPEIAAALGKTPAAIYSLERRALKRLRGLTAESSSPGAPLATKTEASRVFTGEEVRSGGGGFFSFVSVRPPPGKPAGEGGQAA